MEGEEEREWGRGEIRFTEGEEGIFRSDGLFSVLFKCVRVYHLFQNKIQKLLSIEYKRLTKCFVAVMEVF